MYKRFAVVTAAAVAIGDEDHGDDQPDESLPAHVASAGCGCGF